MVVESSQDKKITLGVEMGIVPQMVRYYTKFFIVDNKLAYLGVLERSALKEL